MSQVPLMKCLSSICLVLVIACTIADYASNYSLGWLGNFWVYFNPLIASLLESVLFLVLVGIWIVSLYRQKNRLWTTAIVLGFMACTVLQWYVLPRPGLLVIYGMRDHTMRVCSPDDLRHFARDVHQDVPDINVSHGETADLVGERAAAYRKLQQGYPFMTWRLTPGDGPSVWETDGAVRVEWGGPMAGHWGFSIAVGGGRNDPYPDPDTRILRMSDDIYFYHGD